MKLQIKPTLLALALCWQAISLTAADYQPVAEFVGSIPGNLTPGRETTDGFGSAVKLNGNWAFVSAPISRPFGDIVGGAVYVYKKDCHGDFGIGRDPFQIIALPGVSHHLGLLKVESQGDWLFISCVGTPVEDIGQLIGDFKGAVLVYKFNHGTNLWELHQTIDSETVPGLANLVPINPAAFDITIPPYNNEQGASFGLSFGVDVSEGILVVGAQYQTTDISIINVGAAYSFELHNGQWELVGTYTSPDGIVANDTFGSQVAVHGKLVLISNGSIFQAPRQANGSVYVYTHKHGALTYRQTVHGDQTNQTPVTFVLFGPGVFNIGDTFGSALALNNHWAVIGAGFANNGTTSVQGAVYFFRVTGDKHSPLEFSQKVVSTETNPLAQGFAYTGVAIHDNTAVVSNIAQTGPGGRPFQGAANVYHYDHGAWNLDQILFDPIGQDANFFGGGVDVDHDHIFVGAGFQGINTEIVGTPPLAFVPGLIGTQPPFRHAVIYSRPKSCHCNK